MELRETESSLYTVRDTPAFTCVATTPRGALDALGAPAGAVIRRDAPDGWTRVAEAAELVPGASRTAHIAGEQVTLFNIEGTVHAVEARCTHASAPVIEAQLEGTVLTCARHGSRFDLAQECAVVQGPAARPLRTYAVKIEDGAIYVSAAAPVTG
jgi:3-phenylpropionate/trans-cinnamate dioxygenase ferredoxin subunit